MTTKPLAPSTTSLDEQLCFALYAATNLITRAYRPMLDDLGITYPQYLVLLVLWHDGSRTNGEIAEELLLAPHAVTPLIDRLEHAGLVERTRDRFDRRVVHVTLTDAGRALEPDVAPVQDAVGCRVGLDPDRTHELRQQLHQLVEHMSERVGTA